MLHQPLAYFVRCAIDAKIPNGISQRSAARKMASATRADVRGWPDAPSQQPGSRQQRLKLYRPGRRIGKGKIRCSEHYHRSQRYQHLPNVRLWEASWSGWRIDPIFQPGNPVRRPVHTFKLKTVLSPRRRASGRWVSCMAVVISSSPQASTSRPQRA